MGKVWAGQKIEITNGWTRGEKQNLEMTDINANWESKPLDSRVLRNDLDLEKSAF